MTEGGLDRKEKTGRGALEPHRGYCAATNVRPSKSMTAEWWRIHLHNGFNQSFLIVALLFQIVAALQMHFRVCNVVLVVNREHREKDFLYNLTTMGQVLYCCYS